MVSHNAAVSVYLGQIVVDASVEQKLHEKHDGLTVQDVREALQRPSDVQVAWEDHQEHGRRLIAVGTTSLDRKLIAVLLPHPFYDGDSAETWILKTARWV